MTQISRPCIAVHDEGPRSGLIFLGNIFSFEPRLFSETATFRFRNPIDLRRPVASIV
jgi:hypothetical protein